MATATRVRAAALSAFVSGLLFGAGLCIAGMTRPVKVLAFLDVTRAWDPSLALVMGGAVAVFFVAYRCSLRRERPFFGGSFPTPPGNGVDARVVAGAAIFGVGWGLGGFCPGPAIVSFSGGVGPALIFVPAMAAGMMVASLWTRRAPPL